MASGRAHSIASLAVGGVTAVVYYGFAGDAPVAGWCAAGGLSAVLLSPDLDHPSGYIGLAILRRLPLGKAWEFIWRTYWTPYRWLVGTFTRRTYGAGDSHRSFLSHLPGIGTALRLAWLLWIPLVFGWVSLPELCGAWPALATLLACDVMHSVMDSVMW